MPVHIQDLNGSGKYIGASAVQGRYVYGHKVLRSAAIKAVYTPGSLVLTHARGAAKGTLKLTVASGSTGTAYAYKVNPAVRAAYGTSDTEYAGTELTSGTTEITASAGDIIEVANISDKKVVAVGYIAVTAAMLKA